MASNSWRKRRRLIAVAEQILLGALALAGRRRGVAHHGLRRLEDLAPVRVEPIEGPGAGQILDLALVDRAHIDPGGEIAESGEGPVCVAFGDQRPHGRLADVLDRGQGVADRLAPTPGATALAVRHRLDPEIGPRTVDVGRQQGNSQAVQFLAEQVELVGVAHVRRSGK
jgi:hypothetical protein